MLSLTFFNRCFTLHWKWLVLSALAILFFTRLGFWQIHRAEEKAQILQAQAKFASLPVVSWTKDKNLPKPYQRIALKGHFLAQHFLLDNQMYQHQFGYHVISPLLLASTAAVVLVDQGWIKGDASRKTWPLLKKRLKSLTIEGSAYYPSPKTWVLGEEIERKKDALTIIERINTQLIAEVLHKPVYPFIIRLEKGPGDYVGRWETGFLSPERHYAYAFQWFALALVILILFLCLNLKKINEQS